MVSTNVLVTGAGGFIGSHLAERLTREGFKVKAFVHYNSRNDWGMLELVPKDVLANIEVVAGDVQDSYSVGKVVKGCSIVYHLASLIAIPYSYLAPQSYVATNVLGAVNVMQSALDANVDKVIHASTSECYGTAKYIPIDEKHPLQGQSPYSASKIGADMIAESYHRSFGLPVATIRPFNTFGPRQSARAVIPSIIIQALTGSEIKLGSLHPTRDMNFVNDTVEGFLRIALVPAAVGQVVNIGSGREISVGELADMILRIIGKSVRIIVESERIRPEKSEVERLICDSHKAKHLLGWEPKVTLEEGLERTVEWFKHNWQRYKADVYNV